MGLFRFPKRVTLLPVGEQVGQYTQQYGTGEEEPVGPLPVKCKMDRNGTVKPRCHAEGY